MYGEPRIFRSAVELFLHFLSNPAVWPDRMGEKAYRGYFMGDSLLGEETDNILKYLCILKRKAAGKNATTFFASLRSTWRLRFWRN